MKHTALALTSALLALGGNASADIIKVPGDFSTIQAAVDAAHPGDGISISAGVYKENVIITTDNLILKGRDVIIDGAYGGDVITIHADGVTLSGLEVVNGGVPKTANSEAQGGGITYVGDRALLLRCDVTGSTTYGISLTGHGEVNHCTVTGCLGAGLIVDTTNPTGPQVLLTGNEADGNGSGIQALNGPFLFNRNVAKGNAGDGIHLTIGGAGTDAAAALGTEFSNNSAIGNGGTGIVVNDSIGVVRKMEGGDVTLNGLGLDIYAQGISVSQLDIDFNRKGGVIFKSSQGALEFNDISDNALFGAVIGSLDGLTAGNNTVTANKVISNGGDGIHVESGNNLIRHNSVKNSRGDGIQIVSGAVDNTLLKNALRDNRHDGIDNWGTSTMLTDNVAINSVGADIAGVGDGNGSCAPGISGNVVSDASGHDTHQELELDTLEP